MKRYLAVMLLGLVISACSAPKHSPLILSPSTNVPAKALPVTSVVFKDQRLSPSLAIVNEEAYPADISFSEGFEKWLNKRILISPQSQTDMKFNLMSYVSHINQNPFKHESESIIEWQVVLTSADTVWKKTYQTSVNQKGALKLDKAKIESILSNLADKLLTQTLNDSQFQQALAN